MTRDLKPYPRYKNSGVPWLGQVPEHWKQVPGRACFQEKKESNTGLKETIVLSLSYGRIIVKTADKLHGLVPASFETYQIINPGDIIVRPTDLQNDKVSLRFGLSNSRGIITSAYMCLQTKSELLREYGYLLLHSYDLKKVFYGLGSGLRQNLDWRDFKYLPCSLPPLDEQNAIVRYLDHVDRRVRRYIRAKQKLIKLLEEQKQAVIHQAVTRGLDPDVRLKPSGVDWLGDIPEHWEIRRLKFIVTIKTGGRDTVDRKDDGQFPFFVRSQIVEKIDTFSFDGEAVLTAGDGAGVAKVFHYINGKFDYHQRVYRFSNFQKILGKFFFYYFSNSLKFEAFRETAKSTVDSLRLPMLQNFPMVLPPSEEQIKIIEFINYKSENIEKFLSEAKKEITSIHSFHTRLIADVVTGKLDVREAAARLPAEMEEILEGEDMAFEDEGDLGDEEDATGENEE